ncbi:MAG: zinc-binding dehydrogenase [Nakamurella sp.]
MRAIRVTKFGGPEVLQSAEVADPRPAAGQVLIRVAVTGVLGIDTVIRAGNGGDIFPLTPPYIPGAGVAGTVISAGSPVPESLLGKRVVASVDSGGCAELAVALVDDVHEIPDGVGFLDAMAVLHDGRTAVAVLEEVGVSPGETVLISPAAGGLGSTLVQLAAGRGATVIALARGHGKSAVLQDLGASVVIDQSNTHWPQQVRTAVGNDSPVDVAFDGIGGITSNDVVGLVRSGGRYSSYGFAGGAGPASPDPNHIYDNHIQYRGLDQLARFATRHQELGRRVLQYVADGTIRPLIGSILPLTEAAGAHDALHRHITLGKTLLLT